MWMSIKEIDIVSIGRCAYHMGIGSVEGMGSIIAARSLGMVIVS